MLGKQYSGAEALHRRFLSCKAMDAIKDAEDLKEFRSFSWLLDAEQAKLAAQWQQEAVATAATRLKQSKAKALKDVEETARGAKRMPTPTPAKITAPPLKKRTKASASSHDSQLVAAAPCEEPEGEGEEEEEGDGGLLSFFGAKAM